MTTFTTAGRVRGSCGHKHRTIESAFACANKDARYCKRQGGYSDRRVITGQEVSARVEAALQERLQYLEQDAL